MTQGLRRGRPPKAPLERLTFASDLFAALRKSFEAARRQESDRLVHRERLAIHEPIAMAAFDTLAQAELAAHVAALAAHFEVPERLIQIAVANLVAAARTRESEARAAVRGAA